MKILFLDIDGVVNCEETFQRHRGRIGIDPYMAFLVGKIKLDTGCEVVLSSSWRHHPEGRAEIEKQVVKLYGWTPDSINGFRGDEIKEWLKLNRKLKIKKYVILDDDSDFCDEQVPNYFPTSWKYGLTKEIADKVIAHLNKK